MLVQQVTSPRDANVAAGASAALTEIVASVRRHLAGAVEEHEERPEPAVLRRSELLAAALCAFTGGQQLTPARLVVMPYLCSFADLLRHTLDARIDVRLDVDRDCPAWWVDRTALEEALTRLVLNARDAMPAGGHLTLRASLDPQAGRPGTLLEVIDTGAGMSAELAQAAATPFFTTKKASPFSGMGLPAVGGFAAQSGGSMKIDSRVGVGTSVTLKLQTVDGAANHPAPHPPPQSDVVSKGSATAAR